MGRDQPLYRLSRRGTAHAREFHYQQRPHLAGERRGVLYRRTRCLLRVRDHALNTTYEVFFLWEDAYEQGGFASGADFERTKLVPFNGVGFTRHPRGKRLGNFNWHFPGKQTAVFIDGTLNDDSDRDRGWSVELAFPWRGMEWFAKADGRALPPKQGDEWRMDFSRFNRYKEAAPAKDSGGWRWTRHGIWDSHIPECFARIRFTTNDVSRAVTN